MTSESQEPPLRILLVEDNTHDWIAFRRVFEKSAMPCELTCHFRAEDVCAILDLDAPSPQANLLFDLIVVDHKLPGISGLDFCKILLEYKIPIPLVLLTGGGAEMVAVEALKAGVSDYIIKDPDQSYLALLLIVLPEVVQQFQDRVARREMEAKLQTYTEQLEQMVENKVQELEQERAKTIQMDKLASLGQLATGVAHELRQPLTDIAFDAGYLKAATQKVLQQNIPLDTPLNAQDLYQIGEALEEDVVRCNRIINHLREFARTPNIHARG